ncbi:N-acetylmuramoyl-L-alanine amidase [Bacillus pseudomycoides]|jgi:N-acetylmuramoyl-L-alanine amidase|uniref:N-acetylmuramoyl-L-alanine amidase n=1 Tax=Bacillus pseudomycoides TaxID=64104 RepID=A0ABD6SX52_9BACI|nr:N-acetylmuramoyl-L-alanine amidase family 2 [Bacillus pseudomycoides]EEM08330.1 N-acetylmuramoyl-L-alanine amidase family 2 [Bacillus pseudomycoides]KFN09205.1 putative n-acetylmuramoyl-L-alanine amidase [Bacillus pseudomycoides]MDR4185986.1 N-acetylmuramoyl-L-alanine amidase [Bacillus pseudomycoides]PDZ08265.1 N-acetylmuramoyl-L-alanine amidase [Bacillus pseudomycoides]
MRNKVDYYLSITFYSKVLRLYNYPSWQDKDVAGTVDVGLGFTIDAKVSVNGSQQYKVHNSKGKTYYVTANEAYVYVK